MIEARGSSNAEIVIKHSRFIGSAVYAPDEATALCALADIKKRYSDASHNCYAYCIGEQCNPIRYSDDGEPSGTAGMPILEVIRKSGITNILIVVTRYFGGTLLGAAGLCRAYTQAAAMAVDAIEKVRPQTRLVLRARVSYPAWAKLEEQLIACGAEISDMEYGADIGFTASSLPDCAADVRERISEITGGRGMIEELGEKTVYTAV